MGTLRGARVFLSVLLDSSLSLSLSLSQVFHVFSQGHQNLVRRGCINQGALRLERFLLDIGCLMGQVAIKDTCM